MADIGQPDGEGIEALRFDVALSFAGDKKRDKVRRVAEILRQRLGDGRVFFDEWFEHELAGHDAQVVLQTIYGKSTWLVVTCICRRYAEKAWTQDEWRAIQAFERTIRDAGAANLKRLRFLPLRFGDGEVDGLFDTAIVPDVRERTPESIAELILKRIERSRSRPALPVVSRPAVSGRSADAVGRDVRDVSGQTGTCEQGDDLDSLIERAEALRLRDRYGEARAALDQARRILDTKNDPARAGRIATALGKVDRNQGNLDLARQNFERALELLSPLPAVTRDHADARLQLGIVLRLQDDRAGALRAIEVARKAYVGLVDRLGEGQAALELAALHVIDGNFEAALLRLGEAGAAFDTVDDRMGQANVDRTRGEIERRRDRPLQSLPFLEKARSAFKALENGQGLVSTLFELGESYAQLDRFDDAYRAHHEGQQIAEAIHFGLGLSNAYLAIANLEAKRNRPENAAQEFRRALDYFRSVGNKVGEMQASLGLGSVLIQLHDAPGASKALDRAEHMALTLRDAAVQSNIRYYQAFLHLQAGRFDAAAAAFRQALALAEEGRDLMAQGKALQGLADAQAHSDQTKEAEVTLARARAQFRQIGSPGDAAIAGLSLASLLIKRSDPKVRPLLEEVIVEAERAGRVDLTQIARQLADVARRAFPDRDSTRTAASGAPPLPPELTRVFDAYDRLLRPGAYEERKSLVRDLQRDVEVGSLVLPEATFKWARTSDWALARILTALLMEKGKVKSDLGDWRAHVVTEWEHLQATTPASFRSTMALYYAVRCYLTQLKPQQVSLAPSARADLALFGQIRDFLEREGLDHNEQVGNLLTELEKVVSAFQPAPESNPTVTAAFITRRGAIVVASIGLLGVLVTAAVTYMINRDKRPSPVPVPASERVDHPSPSPVAPPAPRPPNPPSKLADAPRPKNPE